jgi:hypothetical protein
LLLFPTLLVVAIGIAREMFHGNLGTSFRHRVQLCLALVMLAVVGVQGFVGAMAATSLVTSSDEQ